MPEVRRRPISPQARPFNLMFKTTVGAGRHRRRLGARLPAARDGAGDLRQLRQRARHHAPQAAVRRRADRQGVPQRDHARQLHLPHARVRADGDRVLRASPARTRRRTRSGSTRARSGTSTSGCGARTCASASRPRTSWPTTPSAASISSTASRWAGASSRASPTATDYDLKAHSRSPKNPDAVGELRYFDQEQKKHIVPYVIEPSAGADRATLAFLCDAYDESLVKEPPAEETSRSCASWSRASPSRSRSATRSRWRPTTKQRLVAAAEKIAAGAAGHRCRELLGLSDDADANRIEVFKKVRGAAEKLGDEHTRTVLRLQPAPGADQGGGLPAQEERAAPGRDRARDQARPAGRGRARRLRRHRRHRQALPPPGRDRHAVLHHRRLPEPRRRTVTVRDRDTMGQERAEPGRAVPGDSYAQKGRRRFAPDSAALPSGYKLR